MRKKNDALLTATEGFEPSASGNLPSGQQGACISELLAKPCSSYTARLYHRMWRLGLQFDHNLVKNLGRVDGRRVLTFE